MRDKKTIFSHLNHGVIWFIFLITLLLADFSGAQSAGNIPTAPSEPTYPFKQTISKRMAVVLIVLVCFFIFLAVLSVYTRQCADNHFGNNLHLSAAHGGNNNRSRRATRGLDAAVIATFPTFVYSNVKGIKIGKDTLECAICLCEFEDDETLRLLAKCNHVFHVDCIDAWLVSHSTCPVCRASLVPKPGDISFAALLNSDSGMDVTRPDEGTGSGNGDVVVRIVGGNDDENQGVGLISPVRSRSTGWRLTGLFPRSHSTGHLLVRRGENEERYTLRLPEEVRNELVNSNLNRARSCVVLPRMQSSRQGYRTRSGNTRSDRRIFSPTFEKNENENENNDHNRPFTRLRADNDGQGQ